MTKLTIIGAGSAVFTKNIVTDLLSIDAFKKMEIALQDIDPARLKASHELLNVIAEKLNASPKITSHTDRRESLVGSDFVQTTIQVGGYNPSTIIDFEIPKEYGLKQTIADTLGIGGIMRGLRTIPVLLDIAKDVCQKADISGCKLLLPTDGIVARELSRDTKIETYPVDSIPHDGMVLDLGPATVETIKTNIRAANTLLWNGPLGAFEISPFDAATNVAARAAAVATQKNGLLSVAGGGDTVAAINKFGCSDGFTYISTAGGAFLELLEGKILPGIKALEINE